MSKDKKWALYGVSPDGLDSLTSQQKTKVKQAQIIYADSRFHQQIEIKGELREWPRPFSDLKHQLADCENKDIVFLATGDPLWYGVGRYLYRHFEARQLEIVPAISGLQLAAASMGWAVEDSHIISLHGRPLNGVVAGLYPRAKLLILPNSAETVREVARLLTDLGWGKAILTALGHLGSKQHSKTVMRASEFASDEVNIKQIPDFHILAIDLGERDSLGLIFGQGCLPDQVFSTDGQMTKFEARAVAISRLIPHTGGVLWDLGCGVGTIAIDWLRLAAPATAFGVDIRADRLEAARRNADAAGVSHLHLICDDHFVAIKDLPPPDAIFIGGGLSADLLTQCQQRLISGGRLVVHAVTLESEQILLQHRQKTGGDLVRLSIQHADNIGNYSGWRPLMPVTHYFWQKGYA